MRTLIRFSRGRTRVSETSVGPGSGGKDSVDGGSLQKVSLSRPVGPGILLIV